MKASHPITVVIADDQPLIRAGIRMVLEAEPDLVVVGEAENGSEAVVIVAKQPVDIVLMDVRMPLMDGIAATGEIAKSGAATRVIVLTTFDLDEYSFAAIRAGASGFLLKDARPAELVGAIRTVHAGDAVLAPSITRRLLQQFAGLPHAAPSAPTHPAIATLTPRELEILVEIAAGLSNDEIARKNHLAQSTVKTHVGKLLQKLQARDRVQLVIFAYENGLSRVEE